MGKYYTENKRDDYEIIYNFTGIIGNLKSVYGKMYNPLKYQNKLFPICDVMSY